MLKARYCIACYLLLLGACKNEAAKPAAAMAAIPVSSPIPDAFFTNITFAANGTASPLILDRLVALLDAAPVNAAVYICIFGFSHPGVLDALERASDRGVNLHLMIDMSREETQAENPPAIARIKDFIKANSELVVVTSDASASAINHNKFALISEVSTPAGKKENIVFQTSHNFTLADTKKIQDAVVLADAGLYDAYLGYWQDMKAKAASGMKNYYYREYHQQEAGISAFFFPKRRNASAYGQDTYIELLDNITDPATAIIRIGMSDWTAARLNVVNKLGELLDQGARVEVIIKSKADEQIQQGLEALGERGAFVKIYNLTYDNQAKINIHAKFMLITGEWKGVQSNIIVTGCHNLTGNALRNNNEVALLLKDHDQFFNTYTAAFNEMKKLPGLLR